MSNLKGKPLAAIQRTEAIQDARSAVIEAAKAWALSNFPHRIAAADALAVSVARLKKLEIEALEALDAVHRGAK